MTHHAAAERRELVATLRRISPEEPTLCDPWTASDMAAHLILRGSSARYGVQLSRGRDGTVEQRHRELAQRLGYDGMIEQLSRDPRIAPTRFAAIDDSVNLIEYLAHHEDLRRVGDGWSPRMLPADRQRAMWTRLRGMTRTVGRKAIAGVHLAPQDGWADPIIGNAPGVTVRGPVLELMLVALGRARVAQVDVHGDADAVSAFRAAQQMD